MPIEAAEKTIDSREGAMSKPILELSENKSLSGIRSVKICICLLILALFSGSQALAAVWYVTPTGAGSQTGANWDNAFSSIQAAIDAAATNDEIWVKGGTYAITALTPPNLAEILVDKDVDILGGFNGTETARNQRNPAINITTVDGQGNNFVRCFHLKANATIDGFTITGGNIGLGISGGGGILVKSSSPIIRNCVIAGNYAGEAGGAIAFTGTASVGVIANTMIRNNLGGFGTGGISCGISSPWIINCLIFKNSGESVGGINCGTGSPLILNSIVYGNACSYVYAMASGIAGGSGSAAINNTIVWGNRDDVLQVSTGSDTSVTYCNIDQDGFEAPNGDNNIRIDPLFVNSGADDFRVQAISPCIDAGLNWNVLPPIDYEGNPRIVDGDGDGTPIVDIGAYEHQATFCSDVDADGYVVDSGGCTIPTGKQAGDCNDNSASVHPGATEVANNGIDEDCDGSDLDTKGSDILMTLPGDQATNVAVSTNIVVHVRDGGQRGQFRHYYDGGDGEWGCG